MNRLVIPNRRVDYKLSSPFIHLLGPVDNAPKWHSDAIRFIFNKRPEIDRPSQGSETFTVVSPQTEVPEDLQKYISEGRPDSFSSVDDSIDHWVRHYMDLAQTGGTALMWLPKPISPIFGYSMRTMVHLGLNLGRGQYDKENEIRFVIGMEEGFPHYNMIKSMVDERWRNKEVFSTLEATCRESRLVASKH